MFNPMSLHISRQHQGQRTVTRYVTGSTKTVLKRKDRQHQRRSSRIETEDTGYFSILINNGRILRDNLKRMGRDERWLQKQVQQRGTQCIEDVYLLMMNDAGQIYFAAKELG